MWIFTLSSPVGFFDILVGLQFKAFAGVHSITQTNIGQLHKMCRIILMFWSSYHV
jgi:hypothetical protein